jgi:PmbA protein
MTSAATPEMDLGLCDDLLAQAKRLGASGADVTAAESQGFAAGVRLRAVETLKQSSGRLVGLRLFAGTRSASSATSDLRPAALRKLVEDTWALARHTAEDPDAGLPEAGPAPFPKAEGLFDEAIGKLGTEQKLDMATACENAALSADPRLLNSEGAECEAGAAHVLYADSRGFRGEYRGSHISLSVSPVAKEGGKMQVDSWWSATRSLKDLEKPEEIGRTAAKRVLRKLGGRKGKTCQVPVVFDPVTAGRLLGSLCGAVSGASVYRRMSFLADRLGETIASPEVTVVDDALLPGGLGSRPFDAEGIPSRRTPVIEQGKLLGYLCDTYAARKLKTASTASAARGPGDSVGAAPSNFFLLPGKAAPESIVAGVPDGLYVTELMGFGVNGVTGDYSQGAAGMWIEQGRLAYPVEEITIAGNLLRMLKDIDAVGNDLVHRGTVDAPTLRIARMTVAGN